MPYDDNFFASQSDGSLNGAREVLPIVFELVRPASVLDVGCGVGTWLAVARERGVSDIIGADGAYVDPNSLRVPRDRFVPCDLRKPIDLKRCFDLVISMEVAEHLAESAAEIFVDNLARHGSVILFSAAIPGQGGNAHVNEQWPAYWAQKFSARGYDLVDCLRSRIWTNSKVPFWYRQNAFLYVEHEFLKSSPALAYEGSLRSDLPFPAVHPDLFAEVSYRATSTRHLLREGPRALMRTISKRANNIVSGMKRESGLTK